MLTEYLTKKLRGAKYKLLSNGSYFGEIPGLRGVWANARNLEACRTELQEVLEDWLLLKLRDREQIRGFRLRTDRRTLVRK
ncbi:MAG: type II toxin-antitoxin system HicB family antitoxin [Candidatus Sungbacteria bacterium]|nr:type II toxin-antitoxin system HicB family antitoxin [Candidatus Sungbacteria bacterium]